MPMLGDADIAAIAVAFLSIIPVGNLLLLLSLLLLFWLVIPTLSEAEGERTCCLPLFACVSKNFMRQQKLRPSCSAHMCLGSMNKEREEAGSLSTLGMTSQKNKGVIPQ